MFSYYYFTFEIKYVIWSQLYKYAPPYVWIEFMDFQIWAEPN